MNEKYREEAIEAAKDADAVIFMGGLTHDFDTEGQDRADMKLPYGQDALIASLLEVRPDTIVVLQVGSPVDMSAWSHKASTIAAVGMLVWKADMRLQKLFLVK